MASACGEANKLLAMVCQVCPPSTRINDGIVVIDGFDQHSCTYIRVAVTYMRSVTLKARLTLHRVLLLQPAEVKEHVNIPLHVQFWGIDSGIRHRFAKDRKNTGCHYFLKGLAIKQQEV